MTPVRIPVPGAVLEGELEVPPSASGIVVFCHGAGSSRRSPRNRAVAAALRERGLATLLFDLLTEDEDRDRASRFDIPLLTDRLETAVAWVAKDRRTTGLPVGLFGASTGAAGALRVAARLRNVVAAVVSRGGRVDLAADVLHQVEAPTLFIVGERDDAVLHLNRDALERLWCDRDLQVVPGASHLLEEPGALEVVARVAGDWFEAHLR